MSRERTVGGQVHKWGDGQAGIFVSSLKAGFNWAVKQQVITGGDGTAAVGADGEGAVVGGIQL
jgi:hypothetical protein